MVGLSGITVAHFWTALVLLGIGWNFAFVGATTMVTECHRPEERNKVQAFNDFLIFGSMAVGSFVSGSMLAHFGWYLVNVVMFPVVAVAGAMLPGWQCGSAGWPPDEAPGGVQFAEKPADLRRCMDGRFLAISAPLSAGPGRLSRPSLGAPAADKGPLPGFQ